MAGQILNYDALAQHIGHVALNWSNLESTIKAFIYDLCTHRAPTFEEDDRSVEVLFTFLENMEIRQTITNAKALAFEVQDIPGFFDRTETILNKIDNDLRNERNRYMHDRWYLSGPLIMRVKSGTALRREQGSGKKEMTRRTVKEYLSSADLKTFADEIKSATATINALGEEVRLHLNEIRPRE